MAAAALLAFAGSAGAWAGAIPPPQAESPTALSIDLVGPPQPRVLDSIALGDDRAEGVLSGLTTTGASVIDPTVAGGGLGLGLASEGLAGQATAAERAAEGRSRLHDVLRIYANVVPGTGEGSGGGGGGSMGTGLGQALFESGADAELARLVGTVLRPTVEADGRVSFSVLGYGSFALAVAEDRSRIGIVDLNSGRAVVIPTQRRTQTRAQKPDPWANAPKPRVPSRPAQRTTVADFVSYVAEAVLDPFKVGIVVVALIVWAVFRMRGHRA